MSPVSSAVLAARDVTLSFGDRVVLNRVAMGVAPGQRVGVLGPNGVGKSTLLRVLAGLHRPDAGRVSLAPPDATVGYLPQEAQRRPGEAVRSLLARRTGVAAASVELDAATKALAALESRSEDRYATALDRWLSLGGADLDVRTAEVLHDLGLQSDVLDHDTAALSGGQAARVSLAALLLARFDVFLLDEPTNDLDFDGLDRLERFVSGLDAGVVIVSHDRSFLERTISAVVELDEHDHTARRFDGGWGAYLAERAAARRQAEEAYEDFTGERTRLLARARRERQWSEQGARRARRNPSDNDKYIRHRRTAGATHRAAIARTQEARVLLAKFGLAGADVERPAAGLSPGERTRAGLAVLQGTGTNCLVLDEPTNHLDLPAIEQLESALEIYPGTVLLVSHDRHLLDAVRLTRIIEVGGGRVRDVGGDTRPFSGSMWGP